MDKKSLWEERLSWERNIYERKKTRNDRKYWWRNVNWYKIFFWMSILAWVGTVICFTQTPVKSNEPEVAKEEQPTWDELTRSWILARSDLDKPAAEPVTYEDWFRENSVSIEDCKITHYCSEKRTHICGTGDGITATGVPVTPYWTCAVDPDVIPYGAKIMVDYGDSVAFYEAQDCGGAVDGNHIDLAVQTHEEALELGIKEATVYWTEEDYGRES